MNDRFLVVARFQLDDIPLLVCDTLEEGQTLARRIARDPQLLLSEYGSVFRALSVVKPDIHNLAVVTVLRLRHGRTVDQVSWSIMPAEEDGE